jgi:hypothetical protein
VEVNSKLESFCREDSWRMGKHWANRAGRNGH